MILIADDFHSEITLIRSILQDLGLHNFIIAKDGKEAIKLLNSNEVKIVITDFNMPYYNGADVIKEALKHGITKILLRSSHSVSSLNVKLHEAGIDINLIEVISKRDFDSTTLKIYLKNFLFS